MPPDDEEEIDDAFYRQLEVASWSQALVLMGDFNHLDIWDTLLAGRTTQLVTHCPGGSCRAVRTTFDADSGQANEGKACC